MPITFDPHPLA